MRTVVFQFREAVAWGVRLALTASGSVSGRATASPGPVFSVDTATANIGGPALDALHSGFRMMEDAFRRRHGDRGAEVTVHSVEFVVTDFQDEAVTAAVITWLAEEFELEPVRVEVHYSRSAGRYEFAFGYNPWQPPRRRGCGDPRKSDGMAPDDSPNPACCFCYLMIRSVDDANVMRLRLELRLESVRSMTPSRARPLRSPRSLT